ncbi:phosphonate ABC transporter, permease protein PhnE [Natrialba sp. INN-245]|uniref:phosphonate ABC transporter, permease protein PhnE n=1 Tax=Natrialba sp. INN-245 TaxID=2690967 RepID=UPI0031B6C9BB
MIPFLDLSQYWAFISERQLLFDPDVGRLLIADPVAFFVDELGVFSVFGQAGITLAMGLAGTILGFPLALLFGVLGSERVTPFPLNFVFRGTMSAIRSIPALVWALILIPLAGLGPAAATLAIAIDTIGNLGRLFTDELEEISDGPIEAMETTGANRPQTITFGMLSQVTTPYIAWTLYIFEINVRIAVSLGVIGAGGLGQILDVQQGLFQFTNAMATLLCIFLLIISVELFSQRTRARLRADEEPMGLRELIVGLPRRLVESLSK